MPPTVSAAQRRFTRRRPRSAFSQRRYIAKRGLHEKTNPAPSHDAPVE
jgi:hypothetical protein